MIVLPLSLLVVVVVVVVTCPIMWSKVPARASGSWSLLTYLSLSCPVLVSLCEVRGEVSYAIGKKVGRVLCGVMR